MNVKIDPMPAWVRATKYRPRPAPVFPDGPPTRDEIELALALFEELDADSQIWYGGAAFAVRLRARLASV